VLSIRLPRPRFYDREEVGYMDDEFTVLFHQESNLAQWKRGMFLYNMHQLANDTNRHSRAHNPEVARSKRAIARFLFLHFL
jgi:hypothetical protein